MLLGYKQYLNCSKVFKYQEKAGDSWNVAVSKNRKLPTYVTNQIYSSFTSQGDIIMGTWCHFGNAHYLLLIFQKSVHSKIDWMVTMMVCSQFKTIKPYLRHIQHIPCAPQSHQLSQRPALTLLTIDFLIVLAKKP